MTFEVSSPEGLSPSAQYRAMALIAALERLVRLHWTSGPENTAALALLSAEDQVDLVRAANHIANLREARLGAPPWLRHLWLTTKDMHGTSLLTASVGVCLDGAPDTYDAAIGSGLQRLFVFGDVADRQAGPGVTSLPRAVDPVFLVRRPEEVISSREAVFLCHCDRHDEAFDAVRALASLHSVGVTALGVNRRHNPYAPKAQKWGAVSPKERHALWRPAAMGFVHECIDVRNDAFCDEALALGVPLVASRATREASDESLLRSCCQALERGDELEGAVRIPRECFVAFEDIASTILAFGTRATPHRLHSRGRPHEHVALGLSVGELREYAGEVDGEREYAIVVVGEHAFSAEAAGELAARFGYANIFCNLAVQSMLAATLTQRSILTRIEQQKFSPNYMTGAMEMEGLLSGAMTWFEQAPKRVLHVLLSPEAPLQAERLAARLTALTRRSAQRLRVVLDAKAPDTKERISGATIGVEVAGRDLVRSVCYGLEQTGHARFWPRLAGDTSELRTIMPTVPSWLPRPGHDQRVVEASQPKLKGDGLRAAFAHDEVDALYTGNGPFIDGLVGARNAWARHPVPVVGTLHSIHALNIFMQLLHLRLVAPFAPFDGFVSPTECGKQAILKQWRSLAPLLHAEAAAMPDPLVDVVPFGIHTAFFAGRNKLACRLSAGIAPDALLFVQVGRINRVEKGDLAPLLFAFLELAKDAPQARLILVGKPYAPDELDRVHSLIEKLQLHEQVEVRDNVSAEQKAQLLCAADAFVSVSDNVQETYGLVLLEAMAAGTPVIAPRWNGFRELVRDGETGILVDCHWTPVSPDRLLVQQVSIGVGGYGWRDLHETVVIEVEGLVRALRTIASNKKAAEAMGQRAQAWVQREQDTWRQGDRLARALAERARAARQESVSWQRPVPWIGDVSQAFSHYTASMFNDDLRVIATARAHDKRMRETILSSMQLASETEHAAIVRMLDRARRTPLTLKELNDPHLTMLRLMRCMKFGLIRPASDA